MDEGAPTAHGASIGWSQNSKRKPAHHNFYVQRGTGARVRVNTAGTQGLDGGIAGRRVFYTQQRDDHAPRIFRFDRKTSHRSSLPPKVNHNDHGGRLKGVRGDVTVSGAWLLYSGFTEAATDCDYPLDTVMLYNRVSHKLRRLASIMSDWNDNYAGQVNGGYATWLSVNYGAPDGEPPTTVERYNIKTKRSVTLPQSAGDVRRQDGPAVSSDGTVYYFLTDREVPSGDPYTSDLVRQSIGGTSEVITSLTSDSVPVLGQTFVKDRPDGSRAVFFTWQGDIYKVVDDPQSAVSP